MVEVILEKTDKGAKLYFPYELKDDFRRAFRSAKWDPGCKCWRVGPRSVKRAKQWVEEVEKSGICQELETRDQIELHGKELDEIRRKLEQMQAELADINSEAETADERTANYKAIVHKFDKLCPAIEEAKAQFAKKKADESAAKREVEIRLKQVADIGRIEPIRRKMLAEWPRGDRYQFRDLQSQLSEIQEDLTDAGLTCRALDRAIAANYNRSDRDRKGLFEEIIFELESD